MKYEATINLTNKNNAHTQTFDLIDKYFSGQHLRVLEVGCSSGYLGAALVEQGHEVWGVEPNNEAAMKASRRLHKVYVGLIENFFQNNPDERFDVITYGDVLEHLTNPVLMLSQSISFLRKGGVVIASVPNIVHYSIRAMILEGYWKYSDLGILDRTHVKFFTRDTLVDLFTEAGYKVLSLSAVRLSAEQVDEICGLDIRRETIKIVKDYSIDDRGYDFQYVLSARPCENEFERGSVNSRLKHELGIRVLCLVSDTCSSLVDIRLRRPLSRWAARYCGHVEILSIYEFNAMNLEWADIVVFQREANEYSTGLAAHLQNFGKKVVFEIDDLLTDLPSHLSHHSEYINKTLPYINKMLVSADAISVSTDMLLGKYRSKNSNIYITQNYSEKMAVSASHFQVPPSSVKLIVASTDKVLVDVLIDPLSKLREEYEVQIICIGPPSERIEECGIEVIKKPIMSHSEFKRFIASIDNGIGLIPLDSSEFSNCKTAIKYFDYSMCGIPTICSNILPYAPVVNNGVTGLLVSNDSKSWTDAITSLVSSHELRYSLAMKAKEYVMQYHNIDIASENWARLLRSLEVIKSNRRNHFSMPRLKRSRLEVVKALAPHLLRPSSYIKLFIILKRHGLRSVYERVIRR